VGTPVQSFLKIPILPQKPRSRRAAAATESSRVEALERKSVSAEVTATMAPIMIDDDSEDDLPLMDRPKPTSAAKKPSRDSSSSDEPEWMKTFKSPVQKFVDDLSDDDDDDDAAFHAAMTGRSSGPKFEMGSTPAKMAESPAAGDDDEENFQDDDDVEIVEDATPREISIDEVDDPSEPAGTVHDDADVIGKPKTVSAPAPNASNAPNVSKGPPPFSTRTPDRVGEVPLFVPAALNRSKVFFECEGTGEAVDLEGDVGVVGRLLTESEGGMQMDLKGVLYDARILSTPTSIAILAVTATEAKVESVSNDFVQLFVDATHNSGGTTLDGYLGADSDDENERVVAGSAAAAAVRAMGDVSDDETGREGSGKRKKGSVGFGNAGKVRRVGAKGKAKKKPNKRPKKK